MMHYDPTPKQLMEWQSWLSTRPENVRKVATKHPPWELFVVRESGHVVSAVSFDETPNGGVMMTVEVCRNSNPVENHYRVFGIDPRSLTLYQGRNEE